MASVSLLKGPRALWKGHAHQLTFPGHRPGRTLICPLGINIYSENNPTASQAQVTSNKYCVEHWVDRTSSQYQSIHAAPLGMWKMIQMHVCNDLLFIKNRNGNGSKQRRLTRFSLLLCRGAQSFPPRNKLQQSFNLIILKQIGPLMRVTVSSGRSGQPCLWIRLDSQIMISRKSQSFCLQAGPPPLDGRRLLRVPDVDHVAQFLLSQRFKKLSRCSTTTAIIIQPYWAEKRGPLRPHLQPCKHSGPLVAKAVHLHRPQLLL